MSECLNGFLGPELAAIVTGIIVLVAKLVRDRSIACKKVRELHEDIQLIGEAIASEEDLVWWGDGEDGDLYAEFLTPDGDP